MRDLPDLAAVEAWLHRVYVDVPGTGLRQEDLQKARELHALLPELARALPVRPRKSPVVLVDAAAGRAPVGLLAARFILGPRGIPARVVAIERDPRRLALAGEEAGRLALGGITWEPRAADVDDPSAWPPGPALVVALHACGPASDAVIHRTVGTGARRLLLVPCCYGAAVPDEALALRHAARLEVPPAAAPLRRHLVEALVGTARTLRLEAAGYHVEVVSFVAPTVTPHHLLWRARYVGEPRRAARAEAALQRLEGG